MSLVASVDNGKLVSSTQTTTKTSQSSSNDGMNKDTFLQLLVAQMKYQDPLEPTSNTEYISQYAQFSQVESIQSMATNMDLQRAGQLVGKEVNVTATSSNGSEYNVHGKVDAVVYENGKAYLSINESLYDIANLDSVVDTDYYNAYNNASELVTAINKLPSITGISLDDKESLEKLEKTYEDMSDYEKSFVASEKVDTLKSLLEKVSELQTAKEEKEKNEQLAQGDDVDTTV